MKKYFLVVWLMVMMSGNASAGGPVGGSLEVTQWLNFAELANQTDSQYEQWRLQYDRMDKLKKQMEKGATPSLGTLKKAASDISGMVTKSGAIGYNTSTLTAKWDQLYPDFGKLTNTDFSGQYKKWSAESKLSIQTALMANGLQAEKFDSEAAVLAQLESAAGDANSKQSTVALVNAGNAIALAQVEETRKLRQIQMAQNVAQTTYMQQKKSEEDKAESDADATRQNMPSCAKRDINTRRYLNGRGCTDAEYKAWLKQQGL